MWPIVVSWIGLFVFLCVVVAMFLGKMKIPNPKFQSLLNLRLSTLFYAVAIVTGVLFYFFTLFSAWEINALGDIIENDFFGNRTEASQRLLNNAEALWEKCALTIVPLLLCFITVGKVIELRSRSVIPSDEAEFNKGVDFADRRDWATAIACFTEAIRITPDYAEAYGNRGVAYAKQGESEKAIADYSDAIRINPDYAEGYNHRGNAYEELGDKDKAAADFARAKDLGYGPADE